MRNVIHQFWDADILWHARLLATEHSMVFVHGMWSGLDRASPYVSMTSRPDFGQLTARWADRED